MAPNSKLEKNLKKTIRDFQLAVDILPSTNHEQIDITSDHSQVSLHQEITFSEWFRTSIVETYAT